MSDQKIKDKTTGEVLTVVSGKVITDSSYVLRNLITASFIDAIDVNNVIRQVVFGYDRNGLPSPMNKHELIEEQTEVNDDRTA